MSDAFQKGIDFVGVCVVYFCHDGNGRFVMSKRNQNTRDEHGRWDIGGGGVEHGDTIEQTMQREIREEYCTDIVSSSFSDTATCIGNLKIVIHTGSRLTSRFKSIQHT